MSHWVREISEILWSSWQDDSRPHRLFVIFRCLVEFVRFQRFHWVRDKTTHIFRSIRDIQMSHYVREISEISLSSWQDDSRPHHRFVIFRCLIEFVIFRDFIEFVTMRWLTSSSSEDDWHSHDPPAPMNHVKDLRAGPGEMPFPNWYTANTNDFHLTDSVMWKSKNQLGWVINTVPHNIVRRIRFWRTKISGTWFYIFVLDNK